MGDVGVIRFLRKVGELKALKRSGWVRYGVSEPESVSEHSHRLSVMALLCEEPGVNVARACMMATVHDLAEAEIGDITPYDGISKTEKLIMEQQGLAKMLALLDSSSSNDKRQCLIRELWEEYEENLTPEARFVSDLDKFEMLLTADEIENDQGINLTEFFESTKNCFKTKQVKQWDMDLRTSRNLRIKSGVSLGHSC